VVEEEEEAVKSATIAMKLDTCLETALKKRNLITGTEEADLPEMITENKEEETKMPDGKPNRTNHTNLQVALLGGENLSKVTHSTRLNLQVAGEMMPIRQVDGAVKLLSEMNS
jgi:hypothetical protein